MKKVILLGLVIGLIGCAESKTGLEKNVINAAYDNCSSGLLDILKSPSSLKIIDSNALVYIPSIETANRLFGDDLVEKNEINALAKRVKTRYRELGIFFKYEAQNSFGVYLPGVFECSYTYELTSDHKSPSSITLSKIKTGEEEAYLNKSLTSYEFKKVSNINLNDNLKSIMDGVTSSFESSDEIVYTKIIEYRKLLKLESDNAQRLALEESQVAIDATPVAIDATPVAIDATPVAVDATPVAVDATPVAVDATPEKSEEWSDFLK